jgi:hypothetical protein
MAAVTPVAGGVRAMTWRPNRRSVAVAMALLATLAIVALLMPGSGGAHSSASTPAATASTTTSPVPAAAVAHSAIPLFAFYYIWFDPSSWDRAKIDYPQLGRYSSDDPRVMRQQIQWAESAGIDGFIVSWKDTAINDRRLRLLMTVAQQMNFKLALIYQGLDFNRDPLPVSEVAADFRTFSKDYAPDPVFYRIGGKPLTIWSGTWAYTHAQVAQVTNPVRGSMLVLNTEKSTDGYHRVSDVTDGDAYYWSSVNPATNQGYGAKLSAMSSAVHADGKYWIAPFAPGFDARLVGGSSTVDRANGQTLRTEYAAALRSSPDMLGLISWNEFSENTYTEPSVKFGTLYLDTIRELRTTPVPQPTSAADSSGDAAGPSSGSGTSGPWPGVMLIAFPLVLIALVALLARHQRLHALGKPHGSQSL